MAEVGIIMRTRDRPVTLPRALGSVLGQAFPDWQLAIVNDGGDREALETLVDHHLADRRDKATLVHHKTSLGRWAAANAGIAALDCRYLVIHDDDDSWHPQFLTRTVSELSKADTGIGGVATRVLEITEKIADDGIVLKRKKQFRPEIQSLSIAEMSRINQITPISFLYRREIHDEVGIYDDSLPVLGDWEFYLRLLRIYDIRLIDEVLANYHKRYGATKAGYANTVIGGVSQHHDTDARIRNRLLRKDLDAGVIGMGTLVTLGRQARHLDDVIVTVARRLGSYARPWRLFARSPDGR